MKNSTFRKFCVVLSLLFFVTSFDAQNLIEQKKGYTPQIGTTIAMLEDLKSRVTRSVQNLNQKETDFLFDDEANSIGALILHLAATEKYYQVYTFENRGFTKEESKKWEVALNLGKTAREKFTNKPITYYVDLWNSVRKETLRLLKAKDDIWFSKKIKGSSMNNHWAWYHVMEHQANHMGQIRLITKRIPN
jgi:uncharacterized damage-inducible protein DinB